jgi:NADH:ubiquinone oxidoreductase subunit 6 (subunit J)
MSYVLLTSFSGEVNVIDGASIEQIGLTLLGRFVLPFEMVSFVLLAALIGGIALARKDEALISEDQV